MKEECILEKVNTEFIYTLIASGQWQCAHYVLQFNDITLPYNGYSNISEYISPYERIRKVPIVYFTLKYLLASLAYRRRVKIVRPTAMTAMSTKERISSRKKERKQVRGESCSILYL